MRRERVDRMGTRGAWSRRVSRVRPRRAGVFFLALLIAGLALSACGGGSSTTAAKNPHLPTYTVTTGSVGNLGTVLVDGKGITLYMFEPDHGTNRSVCYGLCAQQWPPLLLPKGVTKPRAAGGANPSLLGVTRRRDGSLQVTYKGWPLYLFRYDSKPGQATGQALNNLGGLWYVMNAAGKVIVT